MQVFFLCIENKNDQILHNLQVNLYSILYLLLKGFENLSVEKRRFRLRWDSSPGLSIAGRLTYQMK